MKATTQGGELIPINDCYIKVGEKKITAKVLPDISDSKSAAYNDEPILGRSFPLKTYSHSENRSISMQWHFIGETGLGNLRYLESAVYPTDGDPYIPPVVCKIKCYNLIADEPLCVVLKSYSVKFPTDVPWIEGIPFKFDVDLTWEAIYSPSALPGQVKIASSGG